MSSRQKPGRIGLAQTKLTPRLMRTTLNTQARLGRSTAYRPREGLVQQRSVALSNRLRSFRQKMHHQPSVRRPLVLRQIGQKVTERFQNRRPQRQSQELGLPKTPPDLRLATVPVQLTAAETESVAEVEQPTEPPISMAELRSILAQRGEDSNREAPKKSGESETPRPSPIHPIQRQSAGEASISETPVPPSPDSDDEPMTMSKLRTILANRGEQPATSQRPAETAAPPVQRKPDSPPVSKATRPPAKRAYSKVEEIRVQRRSSPPAPSESTAPPENADEEVEPVVEAKDVVKSEAEPSLEPPIAPVDQPVSDVLRPVPAAESSAIPIPTELDDAEEQKNEPATLDTSEPDISPALASAPPGITAAIEPAPTSSEMPVPQREQRADLQPGEAVADIQPAAKSIQRQPEFPADNISPEAAPKVFDFDGEPTTSQADPEIMDTLEEPKKLSQPVFAESDGPEIEHPVEVTEPNSFDEDAPPAAPPLRSKEALGEAAPVPEANPSPEPSDQMGLTDDHEPAAQPELPTAAFDAPPPVQPASTPKPEQPEPLVSPQQSESLPTQNQVETPGQSPTSPAPVVQAQRSHSRREPEPIEDHPAPPLEVPMPTQAQHIIKRYPRSNTQGETLAQRYPQMPDLPPLVNSPQIGPARVKEDTARPTGPDAFGLPSPSPIPQTTLPLPVVARPSVSQPVAQVATSEAAASSTVMRQVESPPVTPEEAASPDEDSEKDGPDLKKLAKQIYPLIRRRLATERQQRSRW